MCLNDCNIIVVSNEPWGKVWYSKHHYANQLSKNNQVHFVNPASGLNPFAPIEITEVKEGLNAVNYKNIIPFSGRLDFLNRYNDRLILRKLLKRLKSKGKQNIFWSFDPQRLTCLKLLKSFLKIYHTMDSYRLERERKLVQESDLVLVVSEEFKKDFKPLNSNTHFLPHAVPSSDLNADQLSELDTEKRFLLVGNINYRVDLQLLVNLAKKYPDYQLDIVGPIHTENFKEEDHIAIGSLKSLNNVNWLGIKDYHEIVELIKRSKVCLAAYKTDYFYSQYNSLKIMHYLSIGKPVVTSLFHDYKANRDLLFMSDDNSDYLDLLEDAVKENAMTKEVVTKRVEYAAAYSLPNAIKKIEDLI